MNFYFVFSSCHVVFSCWLDQWAGRADEWKNFLARIGRDENANETELFDNPRDVEELRFWASYRGQTLARTGKGVIDRCM